LFEFLFQLFMVEKSRRISPLLTSIVLAPVSIIRGHIPLYKYEEA